MTDRMTPEQRHRCMSHIKSKGTKPELRVRRRLWRHGYRYRLNVPSVPGKPDIVMRPYRTAIFVNGCFWHGHNVTMHESGNDLAVEVVENSPCCKIPTTNRPFWVEKIRRNQERYRHNQQLLQEGGWQVIVVWECQLTAQQIDRTMRQVELQLNNNLLSLYRHTPSPLPLVPQEEPLPAAAEPDTEYNT